MLTWFCTSPCSLSWAFLPLRSIRDHPHCRHVCCCDTGILVLAFISSNPWGNIIRQQWVELQPCSGILWPSKEVEGFIFELAVKSLGKTYKNKYIMTHWWQVEAKQRAWEDLRGRLHLPSSLGWWKQRGGTGWPWQRALKGRRKLKPSQSLCCQVHHPNYSPFLSIRGFDMQQVWNMLGVDYSIECALDKLDKWKACCLPLKFRLRK